MMRFVDIIIITFSGAIQSSKCKF